MLFGSKLFFYHLLEAGSNLQQEIQYYSTSRDMLYKNQLRVISHHRTTILEIFNQIRMCYISGRKFLLMRLSSAILNDKIFYIDNNFLSYVSGSVLVSVISLTTSRLDFLWILL